MFCPNCGNDCKNADCCDICGQILSGIELTNTEAVSEPPVGVYEGLDGTLEISLVSLTIRKQLLSQQTEHVVLFDDIDQVEFHSASGEDVGFLAIREIGSDKPLAETAADAACDKKSVLLEEKENGNFLRVYQFLKYCSAKGEQKTPEPVKNGRKGNWCPKCGSKNCSPILLQRKSLIKYSIRKWYLTFFGMWILRLFYKLFLEGRRFECLDCGCRWFV